MTEIVCLLSTLCKADQIHYPDDFDPFDRVFRVPIVDDGQERYVWTRPVLEGTNSGFKAQPDIVITNSSDAVTRQNIVDIIECKCRKVLNAKDIRAEFGKAYDLDTTSYTIVSYYEQKQRLIDQARTLGLTVIPFVLSQTEGRDDYLKTPKKICDEMGKRLLKSRKGSDLSKAITEKQRSLVLKGPSY